MIYRSECGGKIVFRIKAHRLSDVGNAVIRGFEQFARTVDSDFIEKFLEGERRCAFEDF